MLRTLGDYRDIVGDKVVDELYDGAAPLSEKHAVHVNSTWHGGGVVEMLNTLIPLMNDIGLRTGWRLVKAEKSFFDVTKGFHNALQGKPFKLTERRKRIYLDNIRLNSFFTHLGYHDFVIVHDPQPIALIDCFKKRSGKWLWRCHVDLSKPDEESWSFLKPYVEQYDLMVVSMQKYKQNVKVPQTVMRPSIDPLSDKNRRISPRLRQKILAKRGIDLDKPIIAQVSRFDPWKDPLGVIEAFKRIRKKHDCRLVLLGNLASDDPEGPKMYDKVMRNIQNSEGKHRDDIKILINVADNDRTVNALQTESAVVLQKSIREGFSLTVTEALWKGTPVVGGNVGGIPLQVIDGKTGFLVNNAEECAKRVSQLLDDPKLAEEMGKAGREHVKDNFLITRHLMDYMRIFKSLL